jgi:hypothetical protein
MKVAQITCTQMPDAASLRPLAAIAPQLVLAFGNVAGIARPGLLQPLREAMPEALLAGCSSSGLMAQGRVGLASLVLTALHFETPDIRLAVEDLQGPGDSFDAGARLARQFVATPVHDVLVFGQGVHLEGSALIAGLRSALPANVGISGGLASDGAAFLRTFTLSTHAVSDRQVVALGFGSERTELRHGAMHGWRSSGPVRRVTRASGNTLYQLDGAPALEVYRRCLGEQATGLPASAQHFPLEMLSPSQRGRGLMRSVVGVDVAMGSLLLGGDIRDDGYLRLMQAPADSLIAGAGAAAELAGGSNGPTVGDELALVVSCESRRWVLGERACEESRAVRQMLGERCHLAGFHGHAQIGPQPGANDSSLHNQTVVVTHIAERA